MMSDVGKKVGMFLGACLLCFFLFGSEIMRFFNKPDDVAVAEIPQFSCPHNPFILDPVDCEASKPVPKDRDVVAVVSLTRAEAEFLQNMFAYEQFENQTKPERMGQAIGELIEAYEDGLGRFDESWMDTPD